MRSTKIKQNCSSSLWTCLHHMVILRTQNKITDFLMILAWASPFKVCKAFLSRICHAVVFTQFGYADSKSAPCQAALFLVFPF